MSRAEAVELARQANKIADAAIAADKAKRLPRQLDAEFAAWLGVVLS